MTLCHKTLGENLPNSNTANPLFRIRGKKGRRNSRKNKTPGLWRPQSKCKPGTCSQSLSGVYLSALRMPTWLNTSLCSHLNSLPYSHLCHLALFTAGCWCVMAVFRQSSYETQHWVLFNNNNNNKD